MYVVQSLSVTGKSSLIKINERNDIQKIFMPKFYGSLPFFDGISVRKIL